MYHYSDVRMGAIASQITSLTIVYSTVYSGADQRKHQSSASLAFVRGIHRGPVNTPHKWPVTRKMFPFDDVIMLCTNSQVRLLSFTFFPEWISNYIIVKCGVKLYIHFSTRCSRWSLRMGRSFHPALYWACHCLSMLGLKWNHVSKRGPRGLSTIQIDGLSAKISR